MEEEEEEEGGDLLIYLDSVMETEIDGGGDRRIAAAAAAARYLKRRKTYAYSVESVHLKCDILLEKLESVMKCLDLTSLSKDQIESIELEMSFLRIILLYEDAQSSIDGNWSELSDTIANVILNAKRSSVLAHHNGHQESFDLIFLTFLKNIEIIKERALQYYLSSSRYRYHMMSSEQAKRILPHLLENLKVVLSSKAYLCSPLKEEIEGFEEMLCFFRDSLEFINLCIEEEEWLSLILPPIAAVVNHASLACVSFFFWTEKISDRVVYRVKQALFLSCFNGKMKATRLGLNKIFTGFFSSSSMLSLKTDYLVFLVQNFMELLDAKSEVKIIVMDEVKALREDLTSLTTSNVDPNHSILMHIEVVKSAICPFDDEQFKSYYLAREICSLASISMLEDVKFMYKELSKMSSPAVHETSSKGLDCTFSTEDDAHNEDYSALECLEDTENNRDLTSFTKDQIKGLKLDLSFLRTILLYEDTHFPRNGNSIDLSNNICVVILDVNLSFDVALRDGDPMNFHSIFSAIAEKMEVIKAQVRGYYHHLLLSSSRYCSYMKSEMADRILSKLLENLDTLWSSKEDWFSPMKLEIEDFVEWLRFLRGFLESTNWCTYGKDFFPNFSSKVVVVVDYAACVSFFLWTEKTSVCIAYRGYLAVHLSQIIQKMKTIRLELNEIFTGLCLASKSLRSLISKEDKGCITDFVSFLVQNIKELFNTNAEVNIGPHVEALHQLVLKDFRVYPSISFIDVILMHIEPVKSAIFSFDDEEMHKHLVREMSSLSSISGLHEDVKLMYEEGTLDMTEKKWWMVHCFDNRPSQYFEWQGMQWNISDQFHHIIIQMKFHFDFAQLCQNQLIENPDFLGRASSYLHSEFQDDVHKICIAVKYGMLKGAHFYLSRLSSHLSSMDGFDCILKNEAAVDLICSLLGNIEGLLEYKFISLQEFIEVPLEKLRVLRQVIILASEERMKQNNMSSLLNQIKSVCIAAIPLSLKWHFHKSEGIMYDEIHELIPKITEIEKDVKELCFQIAKIAVSSNSEAPAMIELVLVGIYYLQPGFEKILNSKSRWMIPLKSRIEKLHESLKLLWGFLEHMPDQFTKHEKFNNLITSIATFIVKADCLIECLSPEMLSQVKAKEIDSVLLDLIFAVKIISAQFSLMKILNSKAILSTAQQEQVETLHTGLEFLITYLIDLPRQYIDHEKYNHELMLIKVVANEAEGVINLHFTDVTNGISQLDLGLPLLLLKIKIIHAKVILVSVTGKLKCKPDFRNSEMDGVETFQWLFEFLEILLVNLPKEYEDEKLRNLVALIDKVTIETESIMRRICVKEMNVEMSKEINQSVLGLLRKIKEIKIAYRETFPESSLSRFPRSYVMGFMEFLIEKIKGLLEYKLDLTSILKDQILPLKVELELLITSLRDISTNYDPNEERMSFWCHVADVAYEVEHAIDSLISSNGGNIWNGMICLYIEEINILKMKADSINGQERISGISSQYVSEPSTPTISTQATAREVNEVVVGFEDEEKKLKEKLMGGHSQLDVISVVGMAGLGKTTLAKKIFNFYSNANARHFDVCSSCCVSQTYKKKELLLDILSKISDDNSEELDKKSEDYLSEYLKRSLKGKRYLIFIDDIWNTDVWDELKRLFPNDDNNGSRIILTTRDEGVASYATEYGDPHRLRFFTHEESWSLLQQKLFQSETCPSELVDVGKSIAEKCRGLPLSVILIAGLLQKTIKERQWWESVKESFSSHIDTSMGIVELSYRHLPPYLKPCFLYFGGFREDEEVQVSKLIRLWLAEGFIKEQVQMTNLQELAYNYLMDLFGRSLVMESKRAYDGKIKACRVHDLIHEFCLKKAKEENFLLRINGDYHVDSPHCYSKKPSQRRLSIVSERQSFKEWKPLKSPLRSLMVKVTSSSMIFSPNRDVSLILQSFNLLRVLDLRCIYMPDFPDELVHLIHLRYLDVRIGSNSIPSSISKIWNLQTLLMKGQRGEVCLPGSIWNMVNLKNVHINDRASLGQNKYTPGPFENSVQLAKLETLSTPCLSHEDVSETIIMSQTNLRKLKCRFSESWGYSKRLKKMCNRFPILNPLRRLESLKIWYISKRILHPCEFNLPSNLKKLTLSNFQLQWSEISQLGALRNLEVLNLEFKAFEGEKWEVGDEDFPKLRLLKLDNLNLVRWIVPYEAFPCLEQLVLIRCSKIKEMPTESLGDKTCLRRIEVKWCSDSVAISAKEIRENQVELLGNEEFSVLILPADWDSKPEA